MGGNRYKLHKDGSRALRVEVGQKHRKIDSIVFPEFAENECMWLSSDCKSPSVLAFDDSMLSLFGGTYGSFFGGSNINSIDDVPFVPDRPFRGVPDVIWLESSDRPGICSESGDSTFTQSSICGSSTTTLSAQDEESELLDLDVEESELVYGEREGLNVFDCDFPSPSFRDHEPLFWPFDNKLYFLPDFEKKFLRLSPRKEVRTSVVKELRPSKSIGPGVQNSRRETCNLANRRNYIRLNIAVAGDGKNNDTDKESGRNVKTVPSRLSSLYRASSEKYLHAVFRKENSLQLQKKPSQEPEFDIVEDFVADVSIETLVGLNEFDGHEGISVEYNEDELILD